MVAIAPAIAISKPVFSSVDVLPPLNERTLEVSGVEQGVNFVADGLNLASEDDRERMNARRRGTTLILF